MAVLWYDIQEDLYKNKNLESTIKKIYVKQFAPQGQKNILGQFVHETSISRFKVEGRDGLELPQFLKTSMKELLIIHILPSIHSIMFFF